jgi:hypothetical protein
MKKKIADLSPEAQEKVRAYNREQKAKSRAAQKVACHDPTVREAADSFAADHPERARELDAFVKHFAANVTEDLGRQLGSFHKDSTGHVVGWNHDEEFTVDRVARILLGLKKAWVQEVQSPDGELVSGMYFADVSGSLVESVHRHGLKKSPTFAAMYRELLEMLDKRYGRQPTHDAAIVKAELAGEYVLPPLPESKPEPPKIPEAPPVPSEAEILELGRIRLLDQLHSFRVQDPNVSPDA